MEASRENVKKIVSVCDSQPLTMKGLLHLLASTNDLSFGCAHATPVEWMVSASAAETDVLILDKGLGTEVIFETVKNLPVKHAPLLCTVPAVVVWGLSITEEEALRFLRAGVRGILRKCADTDTVLSCLRALVNGRSWMQDSVFKMSNSHGQIRGDLTQREMQVMELAEQGYTNIQIGEELGIKVGTVKIHLKHIFEKTGVRGRHELALNRLRQKGIITTLVS